jgi:hypothetical protein
MAGVNQHNIPQALLRGFRVPGGSKSASKTWQFTRTEPARLALIKDEVAVEPNFYSEVSLDGMQTLDDQITDYENRFARHLQSLKQASPGGGVDADIAAEVVAHLTIRNAHLRRTFTGGMQSFFSRAIDLFCDEENLRPLLGVDLNHPSDKIKALVDEELDKNQGIASLGLPRAVLYKVAHATLQERFNTFFAENVPLLMTSFTMLAAEAPERVREGHNKALSAGPAPDGRTKLLSTLSWSVQQAPGTGLVLPDCVALGIDDEGCKPLIMADLATVAVVLMPLTDSKMLVGVRNASVMPRLTDFNRAAAVCSHEFFIAARNGQDLEELATTIGASSDTVIRESLESTFKEYFHREPAVSQTDDEEVAESRPESPPRFPKFKVQFKGCADQEAAERIGATISAVVGELGQVMPLGRLDGLTFAADYEAALRDLDRGFDAAPLEPTKAEYGVGVAMAPMVVRDGVTKVHVVMRGDLGHCLIDTNDETLRLGLYTLVQQLAHAADVQLMDEALPGGVLAPLPAGYEAFLYPYVSSAWTAYFTSRASAAFNESMGEAYSEILVAVLKRARAEIPAARLEYRFDGDLDKLLHTVFPLIAEILRFSGKVLGHYSGIGRSAAENEALNGALEEAGLRNWFVLFDADLSALWSSMGKWKSIQEFLALGRHTERLMWHYGMFPWMTEAGRVHINIPLASDASKLVGLRPVLRKFGVALVQWFRRLGRLFAPRLSAPPQK